MEEKKLTDEELNKLIVAIEYQSWAQNSIELSQAAYMLKYQKAEIERLSLIAGIVNKGVAVEIVNMQETIDKQKAEIERLTEEQDKFNSGKYNRALESLSKEKRLNAELQKEIERLKDENFHDYHCMCLAQQENTELQEQVDELKGKICELVADKCNLVVKEKQATKDMAKEILTGILSNCKMAKEKIVNIVVNEDSGYRLGYIKAIEDYTDFILCVAREKGVEVE